MLLSSLFLILMALSFVVFIIGCLWDEEIAIISGFLLFIVCGFAAIVAVTDEDNASEAKLNELVNQRCYPNVVTNRAYTDNNNKITFDCANDGKLRVVKLP